ncbi:hypothetical protein KKF91_20715 [Myxococcota bacterium]|nr:hypothetical protein [Myxococcota bacterium]
MKPITPPVELFAQVNPGLIEACRREAIALGFERVEPQPGGVRLWGDPLHANLSLSIAERILMPIARFTAARWSQLERGARAMRWADFGGVGAFKISARKSRLHHTQGIEARLRAIIPEGEAVAWVRLERDHCTISLDTSGAPLHRRGWRLENGPAPLRETIAAGILSLSGWRPEFSLHDPMCGSGTLLIEAAQRAEGQPPGAMRAFDCMPWPGLKPGDYPLPLLGEGVITGGDRAGASVRVAQRNAAAAEVEIQITRQEAQDARPTTPFGYLITNPPYQRRAGGAEEAFDALDALTRGPFARWSAAILSPHPELSARLKRPILQRYPLKNGGLSVDLLLL